MLARIALKCAAVWTVASGERWEISAVRTTQSICVGGVEFPRDANAPVRTVQILEVADFVCAHGSQVCAEPPIDPTMVTLPHFHMRGGPILTDMFGQSFDWIRMFVMPTFCSQVVA